MFHKPQNVGGAATQATPVAESKKPAKQLPSPSVTAHAHKTLTESLGALLELVSGKCLPATDCFHDLEQLLEALPLTTEEFAVGKLHLQNGKEYLQVGEWGAAKFELLQALGKLS